MANGRYNYESPLNAFLSRSLPAIVGGIADRQARERMALKEMEFRTARDEADKAFRIEENRKTREQDQIQFDAKQKVDNDRYLDNLMQENRRERNRKNRENRADDLLKIQSLSDASLATLESMDGTSLFTTVSGEDQFKILLDKKRRTKTSNAAVLTSLKGVLPQDNINMLNKLTDDPNLFKEQLDATLDAWAKNRNMTAQQAALYKAEVTGLGKLLEMQAQMSLSPNTDQTAIKENIKALQKRLVNFQVRDDGDRGKRDQALRSKIIKILSKKSEIPESEFVKGGKGAELLGENWFTSEFLPEGAESELLKRANNFKVEPKKEYKGTKLYSTEGYGSAAIRALRAMSPFRQPLSNVKKDKEKKESSTATPAKNQTSPADSTFLNQTLYQDPSSGEIFPASSLVGAGQQDTTTKAMIDSIAQSNNLVKVQSAPVNKKEAAKERKEKKDKQKMPGYEKRYRKLVNAARTDKNIRELNKLEEQYPRLVQLNLRGN